MDDCRSCTSVTERMTRYVDGTLPPSEHEAVERHLRACPPCRRDATEQEAGRSVLRASAVRLRHQSLPPGLRARCEAMARAECRMSGAGWRGMAGPAVVAGSLVVLTAGVIIWLATHRSTTLLAAQLSTDHTRCFGRLPADAAPLDASQVEQILHARYGWDVHVPSPAGVEGMRLVEGRRCLMLHGGVPHLLYRVNGEDVSLFVFDGETREAADVTSRGQRARIWSSGGRSFALVSSSSSRADVSRALDYVRREAQ